MGKAVTGLESKPVTAHEVSNNSVMWSDRSVICTEKGSITIDSHKMDDEIDEAADRIVAECITDDMNELEKAWYLYKWIIDNVTYDYRDVGYGYYICKEDEFKVKYPGEPEIGTEGFEELYFVKNENVYKFFDYSEKELELLKKYDRIYHQTAYGCLVQTDCVCAGNAEGYEVLLDKVNIEGYYKVSKSTLHHAWNVVKLDGNWYNIDATHRYFMKSDKYKGFDKIDDIDYEIDEKTWRELELYNVDMSCVDETYDGLETIAQIYETMYGKKKPEREQDSSRDKKGFDQIDQKYAISANLIINSDHAVMITGDSAKVELPGYESSALYSNGKNGRYQAGVIYANRKGTCKLLTGGGKSKKIVCTIKIEQPKMKKSLKIRVGKTKKASLKGTKQAVKYESSDPSVALVSADGRVTGLKNGSAIITATVAGHSYTSSVCVQ